MRRALEAGLAALGLVLLVVGGVAPAGAAVTLPAFVHGPLPPAGDSGLSKNQDVEPGIGVGGDGRLWIGSNFNVNASGDPRTASATGGVDVWDSTDGGQTFKWSADPVNIVKGQTGAGGEDSDLTVAPEKNANGFYNVYATSLWVGSTSIAYSQDGGNTWTFDPVGGIPAEDRPWLAADGPCTFYVSYHQLPSFSPVINKYDLCNLANSNISDALTPTSSTQIFLSNTAPGLTNAFNKLVVDDWPGSPHRHNIYQPMEGCDLVNPQDYLMNLVTTAEQVPICPVPTQTFMGVSADGNTTWSDHSVGIGPGTSIQVWPTSAAVDASGRVYEAWSDNTSIWLSSSTDGGQNWGKAVKVNAAPSRTAVYPTLAAGPAGEVEVAWYGTDRAGDPNDATAMGATGSAGGAVWGLYWARSSDGGATFAQEVVDPKLHVGQLCTEGSACPTVNSRDLYDDFGMVISPTTGRATIAYDSDQPGGDNQHAYTAYATEQAVAVTVSPSPSPPSPNTSTAPAAGGPGAVIGFALLAAAAALVVLGRRRWPRAEARGSDE